ncbi:hypothetical protein [Tenacibaculum xiamenense]|uniref:hypothetical protein n=1 Tax=Tenacibaculum xiamenense TaxID=1261553 RepID=UPI0038946BAA
MKQIVIIFATLLLVGCGNTNDSKMSIETKKEVGTVELVVFKTKPLFTKEQVIEAAEALNPIVTKFNGYLGRRLSVAEDGTWSDIVYWTDKESAEFAAKEVMKSKTCQTFFAMIDEKSMQFMHMKPVIEN